MERVFRASWRKYSLSSFVGADLEEYDEDDVLGVDALEVLLGELLRASTACPDGDLRSNERVVCFRLFIIRNLSARIL